MKKKKMANRKIFLFSLFFLLAVGIIAALYSFRNVIFNAIDNYLHPKVDPSFKKEKDKKLILNWKDDGSITYDRCRRMYLRGWTEHTFLNTHCKIINSRCFCITPNKK